MTMVANELNISSVKKCYLVNDNLFELYFEEEELTCNFCERSFHSVRRLEQHQQRKRHYMCSLCDTVFDGLMLLEMHKETLDHWSDYELRVRRAARPDSEDSEEEEPEEHRVYSGARDELRRLLL